MRVSLPTRRLCVVLVLAMVAALTGGGAALADGHMSIRAEFDESQFELPEGVAVDKQGNIYASLAPIGQLVKIAPRSSEPEPFGEVVGINPVTDLGLLGLAADPTGNIYAGVHSLDPDVRGVWVFDRQSGDATKIPGSDAVQLPNDVAFDKRGNLYISDSALGAIWRVPKQGELEAWLVNDPNLSGTGALGAGAPIGANGIEYHKGELFVAATEQFSLVSVPVGPDGFPGTSEVIAAALPGAPDGLAVDVQGDVYVALINAQLIVRVDSDGEVSPVASGDPLDWPSSIAFGTSRGEQKSLFAVNFSIGEGFGDPVDRFGPAVVEISVGVPGSPLP